MTSLQISLVLNIGSLVLGVGSWFFAILSITTPKAIKAHRNTVSSFFFCVLSLVFQLFEVSNRANIGDYAAIEDTIRAVLIASVVLITVTVALNAVALVKAEKK